MTETVEKAETSLAEPKEKDRFIRYLESLAKRQDRAAFAHLRRGLGKPPKASMEMYPYLGQFLSADSDGKNNRRENAVFIVAALFAYYPDAKTNAGNLGASLRQLKDESDSIEKRFIALLNAEAEELPDYLRQIIGLLKSKDVAVNWQKLFENVQFWSNDNRRVQNDWARSFWGNYNNEKNQDSRENTGEEKQ
jgi:CRISPR system Cascade subunit CasB